MGGSLQSLLGSDSQMAYINHVFSYHIQVYIFMAYVQDTHIERYFRDFFDTITKWLWYIKRTLNYVYDNRNYKKNNWKIVDMVEGKKQPIPPIKHDFFDKKVYEKRPKNANNSWELEKHKITLALPTDQQKCCFWQNISIYFVTIVKGKVF